MNVAVKNDNFRLDPPLPEPGREAFPPLRAARRLQADGHVAARGRRQQRCSRSNREGEVRKILSIVRVLSVIPHGRSVLQDVGGQAGGVGHLRRSGREVRSCQAAGSPHQAL